MNYNPDDTAQALLITAYTGTDASFPGVKLYQDATGLHSGTAVLTSATVTKAVGSVDKLSVTFKGDGDTILFYIGDMMGETYDVPIGPAEWDFVPEFGDGKIKVKTPTTNS